MSPCEKFSLVSDPAGQIVAWLVALLIIAAWCRCTESFDKNQHSASSANEIKVAARYNGKSLR